MNADGEPGPHTLRVAPASLSVWRGGGIRGPHWGDGEAAALLRGQPDRHFGQRSRRSSGRVDQSISRHPEAEGPWFIARVVVFDHAWHRSGSHPQELFTGAG